MLLQVILQKFGEIVFFSEEPGSGKLSNLPKVTQLINCRTETQLGFPRQVLFSNTALQDKMKSKCVIQVVFYFLKLWTVLIYKKRMEQWHVGASSYYQLQRPEC